MQKVKLLLDYSATYGSIIHWLRVVVFSAISFFLCFFLSSIVFFSGPTGCLSALSGCLTRSLALLLWMLLTSCLLELFNSIYSQKNTGWEFHLIALHWVVCSSFRPISLLLVIIYQINHVTDLLHELFPWLHCLLCLGLCDWMSRSHGHFGGKWQLDWLFQVTVC